MRERKGMWKKLLAAVAAGVLMTGIWSMNVMAQGLEEAKNEDMMGALPQVVDLKQTKAADTSVTLQWGRPTGATAYGINLRVYGSGTEYTRVDEIATTKETVTYTIKGLKSNTRYDVQVFAGNQYDTTGMTKTILCETTPGQVVGLKIDAYPSTKKMTFSWNRKATADGYELYKYSLDGKLLSRYETTGTSKTIGVGSNFYSYRLRAYTMVNGVKCRGRLRYFYSALQPKMGTVTQTYGGSTATVDWTKINGAIYDVKMSTSKNGTYKTVATNVKTNKTTLTGLTKGKTYYLIVDAKKKIDGKYWKSPETYVYYFTKR